MLELAVNPDVEMMEQALVLSLLVKGRTVLEDFKWTPRSARFAEVLCEYGLSYELKGHQLALNGLGFQYKTPTLLPYRFSPHALVLLWALASRDTETIYMIAGDDGDQGEIQKAKDLLQRYFLVTWLAELPCKLQFQFQEGLPKIKKNSQGDIPYLMRNRLLLYALVSGRDLTFEERSSIRDQWTRMMIYFGAALTYESKGMENMDELSRRIAKARGVKMERTWTTTLLPTKILTGREYFVPGDATESTALCLFATLAKDSKIKTFIVKNACINTGRVGAITALKRMGALVDFTTRRERYGDAFGDIEIKSFVGKRLQGRRFSEDAIAPCMDEYALLALAACYGEGETILRFPEEYKLPIVDYLELLALNLRKTGVEVGVYENGLVIRGKEELDGGDFDSGGHPSIGLVLFMISLLGKGKSSVEALECVEEAFPGLCDKIESILQKENHEFS